MNFEQLTQARYSCRDFDRDRAIDREILINIINSARLAPSACNKQPWLFIIVNDNCDSSCRTAILESYNRPWITSAPAFIIACGDHSQAWHRQSDEKDHTDIDLAIAIEHLCLAATEMGLGTCWVCNFDTKKIADAFNIPSHLEPIAIIPIGYSAKENNSIKNRKSIDEIIQWGKF